MFLKPNWRILTIGDGDLTFSYSLLAHHQITQLSASVLDAKATIMDKYSKNGINGLNRLNANVHYELDITNAKTWPNTLCGAFDLVIFQFPLVPAVKSKDAFDQAPNQNIVNRNLLRNYLLACFDYFLDKNGARLSYITSKEVKPYSHWQIETDLVTDTSIAYLGKQAFNYSLFPDYQIRNVDRDKQVKDTKGFIYCYSDVSQPESVINQFTPFAFNKTGYCPLCRVGPFTSEENKQRHFASKKHLKLAAYQQQWFSFLSEQ